MASLQAFSEDSVIRNLGHLATSRFTCGGALLTPATVQLAYLNKSGLWNGAAFPGLKDGDIQQLLESSKVASFGKGKEAVIDKSVRDAFVLDTDKCLSSFQLSNTAILGEIRALLVPNVSNIRAELYKINVYTSPTGCFKPHVDTPRGSNMFGSLVVCLPTQFQGGALVARHRGEQVVYDWSSLPENPVHKIQWAAFFGDIEHEILTVTEGYRVTLTYNLYNCDKARAEPDVASPFYASLKSAVGHPHFLREGGTLGFSCQHSYVFEELNHPLGLSTLLKGPDQTVFSTAKSLGLEVEVKPIMKGYNWCLGRDFEYVGEKFGVSEEQVPVYETDGENNWQEYFDDCDDATSIRWCQPFNSTSQSLPGVITARYGNEPSSDVCYQQAAILITIPKWEERCPSSDPGHAV